MKKVVSFSLPVLLVFLVFIVSACTSKQLYDAGQSKYDLSECAKLPQTEYEKCIEHRKQSYEDYERERQQY